MKHVLTHHKPGAGLVLVAAVLVGLAGLALAPEPASAQVCDCTTVQRSICSDQGFDITLVNFSINQNAGTSSWDYEVCNDKNLAGTCLPPKDLSHVNLELPSLDTCLTPTQSISLAQVGGFGNAGLLCVVEDRDPSCDPQITPGATKVAKCDVETGNLDPGKCVVMRLTIAGEKPTLGAGAVWTRTKAGGGKGVCGASDCILGPSCEPCLPPPPDECLTRTAGFWGTHPHITNIFLPVTVCGKTLTTVAAGSCSSATEAMCVSPGKELKGNPAYASFVRQLTAAKLNLAATAANEGSCGAAIAARIAECELDYCGADQATISGSGCIEDLNAFNQSQDTIAATPPPFNSPGPAQPAACMKANGNGLVIGKGACS